MNLNPKVNSHSHYSEFALVRHYRLITVLAVTDHYLHRMLTNTQIVAQPEMPDRMVVSTTTVQFYWL